MLLSAKTEYACLAMLELALHYEAGKPVQVRRIAERHGAPSPFLVQILQEFKRAGLISSTRGAAGGYRLSRPPQEISLADVLDVVEGNNEPTASVSGASPFAPVLLGVCQELSAMQRNRLESLTLAELISKATADAGAMWYI